MLTETNSFLHVEALSLPYSEGSVPKFNRSCFYEKSSASIASYRCREKLSTPRPRIGKNGDNSACLLGL